MVATRPLARPLLSRLIADLASNGDIMIVVDGKLGTAQTVPLSETTRTDRTPNDIAAPLVQLARYKGVDRLVILAGKADDRSRIETGGLLWYYTLALVGVDRAEVLAAIGGDRIELFKTFQQGVERSCELALGMLDKSSGVAGPFLPELCAGKKGVFQTLKADGSPPEPDGVAPADLAAARVDEFIAKVTPHIAKINTVVRTNALMSPQDLALVTFAPDAVTGQHWEKICTDHEHAPIDRKYFTCPPAALGGFTTPSADPTAAGVDEVVQALAEHANIDLRNAQFLFDGAGKVTEFHLVHLLRRGVPGKNIIAVDPDGGRKTALLAVCPGLRFIEGTLDQVVDQLSADILLINNTGGITSAASVRSLIGRGLKLIGGGANNLFGLEEEDEIADLLAAHDVLCVPSPLQNGGGWILAGLGQLANAAGRDRRTLEPMIEPLTRRLHRSAATAALEQAHADKRGEHLDLYRAGQAVISRRVAHIRARVDQTPRNPAAILDAIISHDGPDAPAPRSDGWDRANAASMSDGLWGADAIPFVSKAIDAFAAKGVNTVIEIGPGAGRNTEALAKAGFKVTALDISPAAIEVIASRLRASGLQADLRIGDMMCLPFKDGTFEGIAYFDCLGQVEDPAAALREARRVLRDDGIVALNLFTPQDGTFGEGIPAGPNRFTYKDTLFCYYTQDQACSLVRKTGFEILEAVEVRWNDPPHGDFRPYPHAHANTVIIARKIRADGDRAGPSKESCTDRGSSAPGLASLMSQIGNTPVMQAQLTFAGGRRVPVAIKLEGFQLGGSAKSRAVLGTLIQLEYEGRLHEGRPLVASTSGNYGRAAAAICGMAGLPITLVVDPKCTRENIECAKRHGASILFVDDADAHGNFLAARLDRVRELVKGGMLELDQYNSPGVPTAHAMSLGAEIFLSAVAPDIVFVAASTGGTFAGLVHAARLYSPSTEIKAVDVSGSLTFEGGSAGRRHLNGIGASRRSTFISPREADVLRVRECDAVQACHMFNERVGLRIGGSAGAVLVATSRYLDENPQFRRPLLVFHDAGGYAETVYNPTWLLATDLDVGSALPLVDIAA